jgi:hypothetical protein
MMSVRFHMAKTTEVAIYKTEMTCYFILRHIEYRAFLNIFLYNINISITLCCLYAIFLLVETS